MAPIKIFKEVKIFCTCNPNEKQRIMTEINSLFHMKYTCVESGKGFWIHGENYAHNVPRLLVFLFNHGVSFTDYSTFK